MTEQRCAKCDSFHAEWKCPYPAYPALGTSVEKHRRRAAAAGGVASMTKSERREYGNAVSKAIRAKQRAELRAVCAPEMSETPKHRPPLIARLFKFTNPPRGLAGNPDSWKTWNERDELLYVLAMQVKHAMQQ